MPLVAVGVPPFNEMLPESVVTFSTAGFEAADGVHVPLTTQRY